jgi:hypothetical protein
MAIIPTNRGSIARWVLGVGRTHINDSGVINTMTDRLYQLDMDFEDASSG